MDRARVQFNAVSVLLSSMVLLFFTSAINAASVTHFMDLTADVGAGFGNPANRYLRSLSYTDNGTIIAGTMNMRSGYDSTGTTVPAGAELWRRDSATGAWTQVVKAPTGTSGFRGQTIYQGCIYAATVNKVLQTQNHGPARNKVCFNRMNRK